MRFPLHATLALVVGCLGTGLAFGQGETAAFRGSASLLAQESSLSMRLCTGGAGDDFFSLSMGADAKEAELRSGLRLSGKGGQGSVAYLLLGPGEVSGPTKVLADPAAFSAGSYSGRPVALDTSLGSGTAILSLGAGPAAFFAVERGGAGLVLRRPGILGEETDTASPTEAAAGLCLSQEEDDGAWRLLSTCSLREGRVGGEGWLPDPPADPAGLVLQGALVRERIWPRGRLSLGLATSFGRTEGPGLAGRLEAEARSGSLLIRLAAGAAGPGFRNLFGAAPQRSLGVSSDFRLALARAAILSATLRLESAAAQDESAPAFGRRVGLGLSLPYGDAERRRLLELRCEIDRPATAPSGGTISLGLRTQGERSSAFFERRGVLSVELGGMEDGGGIAGVDISWEAWIDWGSVAAGFEGRGPALGVQLALGLLEKAGPATPVKADGRISLELPLRARSGASLALVLETDDEGIVLAPLVPGASGAGLSFSLGYRAELWL